MNIPFQSLLNRSTLFVAFVALVLLASLFELYSEFSSGEKPIEMFDDVVMFILGVTVLCLICSDYFKQQRLLRDLKNQLESVRGKLDQNDRHVGNQYRAVIQKQFDAWHLTPAEQAIALTLIKGLSFKEIAQIRQTQEKTARQHAANVYRKAGLSGRHELAGWFFEDLFDPDPVNDPEPVKSYPA